MIKKGLCSTCTNDKDCTFPRKFPVRQCDEFNGYETIRRKTKINKKTKQKTRKHKEAMAHI
jgi:hypothetical protein